MKGTYKIENGEAVEYGNFQRVNIITGKVDLLEVARREQECINGTRALGDEIDLDLLMDYIRAGEYEKFAIGDWFTDDSTDGIHQWAVTAKKFMSEWAFGDSYTTTDTDHVNCMAVNSEGKDYQYNATNTNAGGYAGSLMPANMETEFGKLSEKLQGYCKTTRIYENNKGNWAPAYRNMRIPTIVELTGNSGWTDKHSGGICSQLPLCRNSRFRFRAYWYWAGDPATDDTTRFCNINHYGNNDRATVSNHGPVRPEIILG